MNFIDFRSDTITRPNEGMRKAMYEAEVGDDVYGEDPTVNRLEELGAAECGKEASLFVPSGTMANLTALYINCKRGSEVLAHEKSHIFHFELASMAVVAGLMPRPVPGENGKITPESISDCLRDPIYYLPANGMIEIENTHNLAGGTYYTRSELEAIARFAAEKKLPVHMDGARLFNAAAASGMTAAEIGANADTVGFCLSKGLGAPAGSLICGSSAFVREARKVRKMLGGGMRQSGILAAAGIYALENNIPKLKDDHEHARMLAESLHGTDFADIEPSKVHTNILFFRCRGMSAYAFTGMFKKHGMLVSALERDRIRIVTHLGISANDIKNALIEIEMINDEFRKGKI